jgi:hypothetical protein
VYFENDCLVPPDLLPTKNEKMRQTYMNQAEGFWNSNAD